MKIFAVSLSDSLSIRTGFKHCCVLKKRLNLKIGQGDIEKDDDFRSKLQGYFWDNFWSTMLQLSIKNFSILGGYGSANMMVRLINT